MAADAQMDEDKLNGINRRRMPKQRSDYKEAKFDSNRKHSRIGGGSGRIFIWVFIHSIKAMVKKRVGCQKVIPSHRFDIKPPVSLTHYQDGNQ